MYRLFIFMRPKWNRVLLTHGSLIKHCYLCFFPNELIYKHRLWKITARTLSCEYPTHLGMALTECQDCYITSLCRVIKSWTGINMKSTIALYSSGHGLCWTQSFMVAWHLFYLSSFFLRNIIFMFNQYSFLLTYFNFIISCVCT